MIFYMIFHKTEDFAQGRKAREEKLSLEYIMFKFTSRVCSSKT